MLRWLRRKFEKSTPSNRLSDGDQELVKTSKGIVGAYLEYLEAHPIAFEIRDVSALPFDKAAILNALRIDIATEGDSRTRQALIQYGVMLANFREGIGSEELSMMPPSLKGVSPEAMKVVDGEMLVRAFGDHQVSFEKHQAAYVDVLKEQKEIGSLLYLSEAIAAKRT